MIALYKCSSYHHYFVLLHDYSYDIPCEICLHLLTRLTPVYAVVIMLVVGYYRYVAVGPLALETDIAEPCLRSWWSLLLYIDNFVYYNRAVSSIFTIGLLKCPYFSIITLH